MGDIRNLAILSSFLATLILLCSWEPLSFKLLSSSEKHLKSISEEKDELELALEKASVPNKTVIITIINKAYVEPHENEFPSMLDLFLEGFWVGEETRPLIDNLLVVSMDKTAQERCEFRRLNCYKLGEEDGNSGGGDRFAREKVYMTEEFIEMMWRRTLFLLNVLKRGYNFIFTDTDILWLRNPFTRLMNNETVDLQISTDFFNGTGPYKKKLINTGFYFIKSNNKTTSLFEKWYDARKNSTGLKEQDVLVNLMRGGVLEELDLNSNFLNTLYFSGFCKDSKDVRSVVTVHANCCRSIKAKVADLKAVLRDWERYKGFDAGEFRWSEHVSCLESWIPKASVGWGYPIRDPD